MDKTDRLEVDLIGTAVSRGLAVGNAVRLHGTKRQFFRVAVKPEDIDGEIGRFSRALETAAQALRSLAGEQSSLPIGSRSIFDAHLAILEHSDLVSDVKAAILTDGVNAEWAITRVSETLANKLRTAADIRIREKYVDVQDVAERLLNTLAPEERPDSSGWVDAIVVASTIRPSTMVELARSRPRAIVTEHGGWTSHAFIMAREMGIPAVTGLKDLSWNVTDGDRILVDGFSGRAIIRPLESTIEAALQLQTSGIADDIDDSSLACTLSTVDGHEIVIRANVEQFASSEELRERGACGIGLLRSEYLFDQKIGKFPDEEVQLAAYRKVAQNAGSEIVRIRTFDLNADQITLNVIDRDKNPSLGLRAIRLSLSDEQSFRVQIRAILRANTAGTFAFILPMVSGLEDILLARGIIDSEFAALVGDGAANAPEVGVMIEVPSAVMLIDEIVKAVDFVCIGTNDLVQYMLAADRDNESVAGWYQTLHPAVIRAIQSVLAAARTADIPAVICGEMAGSAFYAPLLIGLGAKEFSMNINAIRPVRRVISGISFEECRQLAEVATGCVTARAVEESIKIFHHEKWPHLFEGPVIGSREDETAAALTEN